MKNSIRIFIILCFIVASFSKLKSQSTYTITNSSGNAYYVELHIATDPTECHFDAGTSNRTATHVVGTGTSCSSQATEGLGTNEWVYKVEIYEYSTCSVTCTGSIRYVNSILLCPVAPMGTTWSTNCSDDEAAGNRTTYLDIEDQ